MKKLIVLILCSFYTITCLGDDLKKIDRLNTSNTSQKIKATTSILSNDMLLKAEQTNEIFNQSVPKIEKKGKILKLRGGNNIYSNNVSKIVLIFNPKLETIGAGSLVDKEGFIVTNWHVVQNAEDVFVWFKTAGVEEPLKENVILAKVITTDKEKDLGVIKTENIPAGVSPISIGKSDDVSVGDTVHAIGHPEGLYWSYTQGVVSAKRKKYKWAYKESEHEANMIQTQTPISSGNSGGALLDSKGNLVGINTANFGAGQNLNFAVEVDHAKNILANKPSSKKQSQNSSKSENFDCLETSDHNKNGVIDTCFIDKNKNGKPDGWLIDDDEDGYWETVVIDKNENGNYEVAGTDKNKNGQFEIGYIDENDDGKLDTIAYDYNEDGEWDEFKKA